MTLILKWSCQDRPTNFLSKINSVYVGTLTFKDHGLFTTVLFYTDYNLRTLLCPFSLSYQDLSTEQARYQEQLAEVQRLSQKLQKADAELKRTTDSLNQSQEKIESLSKRLKTSESLLQLEKSRESAEVDATSNSNSDSSNKAHICQTHTQEMSHLDPSPEAGKGRDFSMTHEYATGETERQLSERVIELQKEVRVCVWTYCGTVSLWISFTGCLCGSVQFLCDADDLYHVEILAQGMLQDYQLSVGRRFPEYSTLFPELLLYLCSSVFIMSPRPLLIFLISSAALML